MNNRKIVRSNIEESKKTIQNIIRKEQLIIFFSKLLEKNKHYSEEIRELFYLLFPYSEMKKYNEIIKKIRESNLTKTEGLELTKLEEHFIKSEIIGKEKINIQKANRILEYLIKKYFTRTSLCIDYIVFSKLLLHSKNSKNILNMQIEKIVSLSFDKHKVSHKEKIKLAKRFLEELKKDIENDK